MNTNDFVKSGGRIVHIREGRRTITIAYTIVGMGFRYGATIHRQDHRADAWVRTVHNETAVARHQNCPVFLECGMKFDNHNDREQLLRQAMFVLGCKAPWERSPGSGHGAANEKGIWMFTNPDAVPPVIR